MPHRTRPSIADEKYKKHSTDDYITKEFDAVREDLQHSLEEMEQFENFSAEIFGEALSDAVMRHVPSLLTLFTADSPAATELNRQLTPPRSSLGGPGKGMSPLRPSSLHQILPSPKNASLLRPAILAGFAFTRLMSVQERDVEKDLKAALCTLSTSPKKLVLKDLDDAAADAAAAAAAAIKPPALSLGAPAPARLAHSPRSLGGSDDGLLQNGAGDPTAGLTPSSPAGSPLGGGDGLIRCVFSSQLIELGVEIVDDCDYESDGEAADRARASGEEDPTRANTPTDDDGRPLLDNDAGVLVGASKSSSKRGLDRTSSFAQSMSQFAFRREEVMRKIEAGELVAETAGGVGMPHVTQQVDVSLYSDENQARRRMIKKHPQFCKVMTKFWDTIELFKDQETKTLLRKESYLTLSHKIARLIIPPPYDNAKVRAQSEADWDVDTNGSGKMVYADFFLAIFQIVDNWTETCNAEDYIEFLLRLVNGICWTKPSDGLLHFRDDGDINYDRFFSFLGESKEDQMKRAMNPDLSDPVEDRRPSRMLDFWNKDNIKKRRPETMKFDATCILISKLYTEKIKSDAFVQRHNEKVKSESVQVVSGSSRSLGGSTEYKKVRFDAFVLRYFKSLHGNRGLARKHLKAFVSAVQVYSSQHPRVDLFRKLVGVPKLHVDGVEDETYAYIPTIIGRYFLPVLLKILGASSVVDKLDVKEVPVELASLVGAMAPCMSSICFGSRMLDSYKKGVAQSFVVGKDAVEAYLLASKADKIYTERVTLTASATETLDLAGSLVDALGAVCTFVAVKAIILVADAGNTNDVVIGGAAATQFVGPLGDATDKVKVRPGGFLACIAPDATGWQVGAGSSDNLKIANGGGTTSVTFDLIIIGASA